MGRAGSRTSLAPSSDPGCFRNTQRKWVTCQGTTRQLLTFVRVPQPKPHAVSILCFAQLFLELPEAPSLCGSCPTRCRLSRPSKSG